jgi:class 3 adenylate cyclase
VAPSRSPEIEAVVRRVVGARIAASAGAGEIMVSSTTADMAGSVPGIELDDMGLIVLKGLSGTHQVFTVSR